MRYDPTDPLEREPIEPCAGQLDLLDALGEELYDELLSAEVMDELANLELRQVRA